MVSRADYCFGVIPCLDQPTRVETLIRPQVGGFEVLTAIEKIPTDDEDRPLEEVKITSECPSQGLRGRLQQGQMQAKGQYMEGTNR